MADTGVKGQRDPVIWVVHLVQGLAGMPRLAARVFPGRCAQALGSGLGRAIGGGRVAAVATVCVEPLCQVADLRGERLHLVRQRQDHLDERLGVGLGQAEQGFAGAGHGVLRQRACRKLRMRG